MSCFVSLKHLDHGAVDSEFMQNFMAREYLNVATIIAIIIIKLEDLYFYEHEAQLLVFKMELATAFLIKLHS